MLVWPIAALLLLLSGTDANKHFRPAPPQVDFPECRSWYIEGDIVAGDFPLRVDSRETNISGFIQYTPNCELGAPILDLTQFRKTRDPYIFALLLDYKQTPKWIYHQGPAPWQEPFHQSVVVVSVVAACCVAMVWILTLVSWTQMHERSWIMLISITAATITLTIAFGIMISATHEDYNNGVLDARNAMDILSGISRTNDTIGRSSLAIAVLHYLSGVIIYAAELECLLRAFSDRINERRVVMWGGIGLVIGAKTLWAVYVFVPVDSVEDNSTLMSVTVGAYLLETAISVLFACSLFAFGIDHVSTAYSSFSLPCGIGVHLLSLVPFAAFITDLALTESTRWMWYVRVVSEAACVVLLWTWMDRIEECAEEEEAGAILGRRVFPEENQTFDKIGYITGGNSSSPSYTPSASPNSHSYVYEEDKVRNAIMRFLPSPWKRPDTASSSGTAYVPIWERVTPEKTFHYPSTHFNPDVRI